MSVLGRQRAWLLRTLRSLSGLLMLAFVAHAMGCAATPIVWLDDPELAEQKAHREGRLLLITATTEGCGSCRRLEKETWPDSSVRRAARGLVALRLNLTDSTPAVLRWQHKLHIEATPVTWVWDPNDDAPLAPPLVGFASKARMANFIVSAKKAP